MWTWEPELALGRAVGAVAGSGAGLESGAGVGRLGSGVTPAVASGVGVSGTEGVSWAPDGMFLESPPVGTGSVTTLQAEPRARRIAAMPAMAMFLRFIRPSRLKSFEVWGLRGRLNSPAVPWLCLAPQGLKQFPGTNGDRPGIAGNNRINES